jgi:hypothetical protein
MLAVISRCTWEASRRVGVRKSLHPSSKLVPSQAVGSADFLYQNELAHFVALFEVCTIVFMTL